MEFKNNFYDINNLCLAKLGKTVITPNPDTELDALFILYRNYIDNGYDCDKRYEERYSDAVLGLPISERASAVPFENLPEEIRELYPFPREYLTEEEVQSGLVSDIRLYQIFIEMNMSRNLNRE